MTLAAAVYSNAYWDASLARAGTRLLDDRVHPRQVRVPAQAREDWLENWQTRLDTLCVPDKDRTFGAKDYADPECIDFSEPIAGTAKFMLQAAKEEDCADTPVLVLRFIDDVLMLFLEEELHEDEQIAEATDEEEAGRQGDDRHSDESHKRAQPELGLLGGKRAKQ
jgi:hypothetical protein